MSERKTKWGPDGPKMTPEQQAIAEKYIYLPYQIVSEFIANRRVNASFEEMYQDSCHIMCRAIINYDGSFVGDSGKIAKLTTYLNWCLSQSIKKYKFKTSVVHVPHELMCRAKRDHPFRKHIEAFKDMDRIDQIDGSVDVKDYRQNPEEAVSEQESRLWEYIDRLSDGHRHVVVMRYFGGMTLEEIGECLGLTREAIRRRQIRAIELLKEMMIDEK